MASGKWERVGKGGKPANKATGQQKSVKNIKDNDKPLDGSQLQLTGMSIILFHAVFDPQHSVNTNNLELRGQKLLKKLYKINVLRFCARFHSTFQL